MSISSPADKPDRTTGALVLAFEDSLIAIANIQSGLVLFAAAMLTSSLAPNRLVAGAAK